MAELSLDDAVSVPDVVLSRELQGETVVLNLDTGIYFGLDRMATAMWEAIRHGDTLRAAFDALIEDYDVAPDVLEGDLLDLADRMLARGLIRRRQSATP